MKQNVYNTENSVNVEYPVLKRCFRLRETITITVGTVIGVGLFTVGANVVGLLGPSVIFATLLAMVISIYPALLYAEMGSSLPYAGGTYQYASFGLGRPFGMLAGWNFIISMVSVASGEALAFSFYIRTLFEAFGIELPVSDTFVAGVAIAFFLLLALRGVEMTGRLQNGFMFFFWGVTAVWILTMIPALNLGNFTQSGAVPHLSLTGFLPCVALIWWCFAGFETCCAMGEEICHPQINLPRALFLAPFIVFSVTGLFQWVLVCIVPADSLSLLISADAPYAQGMRLAGILGFPLILLCLGIAFGGDFSTLNASVCAPARYLYTMARDGSLPKMFAYVNPKTQSPVTAVLALGLLMLLLVCTNSITYIASLSLFATLFYYILGILSAGALRRKRPDMVRPYRAPFAKAGVPLSIVIYLFMMTQLELTAVFSGIAWCALGLVIYFLCSRKNTGFDKTVSSGNDFVVNRTDTSNPCYDLILEPPTAMEKQRMDREFHIWRNIVCTSVLLVLALFAGSFLIS